VRDRSRGERGRLKVLSGRRGMTNPPGLRHNLTRKKWRKKPRSDKIPCRKGNGRVGDEEKSSEHPNVFPAQRWDKRPHAETHHAKRKNVKLRKQVAEGR